VSNIPKKAKKGYMSSKHLNDELTPELLEIITAETLMLKGVLRFLAGYKFKSFLIFRDCWKTFRKYELIMVK
jgi:hypothetical protein